MSNEIDTYSLDLFTNQVLQKLPRIQSDEDADRMITTIHECFRDNWTISHTVAYCECFQEVSPNMDESVAMREMDRIREFYNKD